MTTRTTGPEIRKLSLGSMDNNVYIVVDPETRRGVIVDASADAERIAEEARGVQIDYILITHGDHDHVDALDRLRRLVSARVGVHREDADGLTAPPDFELEDGQEIAFGNTTLRVLHTPGHTPGSLCYYTPGILIAGDTLFPGGPGNTYGDSERFRRIITAISEKLFVLPDDTQVLPGHGRSTTIGAEQPHLEEWIARGW